MPEITEVQCTKCGALGGQFPWNKEATEILCACCATIELELEKAK